MAADEGSQAHRAALSRRGQFLFLYWQYLRNDDPPRTAHAAGRSDAVEYLQQDLHPTRDHHGVLLSDPVDPGDIGEFFDSDDDRCEGSRVPTHQFIELVYLHHWRNHYDLCLVGRRGRHRLDVLCAL